VNEVKTCLQDNFRYNGELEDRQEKAGDEFAQYLDSVMRIGI
jgi:hypothetical protein